MTNHILAGAVDALAYIANAVYPDEKFAGQDYIPGEAQTEFTRRLRALTERYWPELWQGDEDRALGILRNMREYLQRFWREKDEHARDWFIHRAREYHQHQMLHPHTPSVARQLHARPFSAEYEQALRNLAAASTADEARDAASWVNIQAKRALDEPPQRTIIEQALFELQRRAQWASLAPAYCRNADCTTPYFLPTKKSQKFCTPECAHTSLLASKKAHWKHNKAKYNKKRSAR